MSAKAPAAFVALVHDAVRSRTKTAPAGLVAYGKQALDWLDEGVPAPADMHPRDFGEHAAYLIGLLSRAQPHWLAAKLKTPCFWGRKWLYINAAVVADLPELRDDIVACLAERSVYVKSRVLMAIEDDARLLTQAAREHITKLLKTKSADNLNMSRGRIEALLSRG